MSSQPLELEPVPGPLQPHELPANVGFVAAPPERTRASMHTKTQFTSVEGFELHNSDALQFIEGGSRLEGGTADVEQATLFRASVAVKKFRIGGQSDRRRLQRFPAQGFVNELQITSELDHPNIVKLVGFVKDDRAGIAWLIFGWEANGNIRDFLSRGKWDLPERVALIQDVAAGLDYIHSQQPPICHGDMKSLNILVNSEYRAVIADFGSARKKKTASWSGWQRERGSYVSHSERAINVLSSSTQGTLTGPEWTLRWAAPELMSESGDPDLPSDIWSFGWVSWEVITDNYPFPDARAPGRIVLDIVRGNLPMIHQHTLLAQIVPLCSLITDCWRLNPIQRPAAADVLKALKWIPSTPPSPRTAHSPEVRSPELLWQLGRILFFQSQSQDWEAIAHLENSLTSSLSTGNIPLHASCLIHCGDVARHHSHYKEAENFYNRALTLYKELDSAIGQAYVNLAMGDLRRMQGNLDEAKEHLSAALEEGRRHGNNSLKADSLFGLGATYRLREPPSIVAARECFVEALDLYVAMGNERGMANSLDGLGLVSGDEGKFGKAITAFKLELKISSRIGCSATRAHALRGLGLAHANHGRHARARERLEEAAKLYKALDQASCEATTLAFLNAVRNEEALGKRCSRSR
ncbi:hypothetical protein FS837_011761 [Tulasnella sp. UAMH 9824]|nr:hypothetical protein FS837_011761 [Tulasnella sp. UAMH 9824]